MKRNHKLIGFTLHELGRREQTIRNISIEDGDALIQSSGYRMDVWINSRTHRIEERYSTTTKPHIWKCNPIMWPKENYNR